jgi:hypothetical protein
MRAGVGDTDAVIFLKEPTKQGIVEALDHIASMSDAEIIRRKQCALDWAQQFNWEQVGKKEYVDEFIQALQCRTN